MSRRQLPARSIVARPRPQVRAASSPPTRAFDPRQLLGAEPVPPCEKSTSARSPRVRSRAALGPRAFAISARQPRKSSSASPCGSHYLAESSASPPRNVSPSRPAADRPPGCASQLAGKTRPRRPSCPAALPASSRVLTPAASPYVGSRSERPPASSAAHPRPATRARAAHAPCPRNRPASFGDPCANPRPASARRSRGSLGRASPPTRQPAPPPALPAPAGKPLKAVAPRHQSPPPPQKTSLRST